VGQRRARTLSTVTILTVVALSVAGVASGAVTRSTAAARHTTAAKINVVISDTSFRLSAAELNAGTTTFLVTNKGKRSHALEISGPGIAAARTAKLGAGKSATLTVTLQAGAYMVSDPVGLSAYNVQYLDVAPAETVSATGNSSVVAAPVTPPPMCGMTYEP
jgi:plastocyanin